MSGGADGLVKLWTVRSDECEATLDAHTDKVWALTIAKKTLEPPSGHGRDGDDVRLAMEERGLSGPNHGLVVISGGADSVINMWQDVTAREEVRLVSAFCVLPCTW